jgi:hypothetical protein
MFKAILGHFNANLDIVNSIPALKAGYESLKATVDLIAKTLQQKEERITGTAVTKRNARRALARQACTLAQNIFAYAEVNNDEILRAKVNYTMSDLIRLRDGDFPAVCSIILNLARQRVDVLAGYNVTVAAIEDFDQNISAYEALEQSPRNLTSKLINFNESMVEHIRRGNKILKNQLDKLMSGLMETQQHFYYVYFNNRAIIDASTTHTQIKGKVTDALTGAAIYGATIEVVETKQTATTSPNGNYAVKHLKPDIYTVTISKPGFKSQTKTVVVVKLGQVSRVSFKLEAEQ